VVISVQGEWNSPNTLLTMAHGQVFRIITLQPPSGWLPISTTRGRAEQLGGFEPREPSPVPSVVFY